jgi:hypothetical protein
MECIDRVLDAIPLAYDRRAFSDALLAGLDAEGPTQRLGDELAPHVGGLRAMLVRLGVGARFVTLATEALRNTEEMRTTDSVANWLACVRREGVLTVEMALCFIDRHTTPSFVAFFRSVAELGNLFDKLVDARADHRRGEMALRPGVLVHARLLGAVVRRVPRAASLHPRLPTFFSWAFSYIVNA